MRILIIDDDPDLRDVVSLFFEMKWPEATVSLAPDGRSGLQIQEDEDPDLVILDLGLPDIDGLEVCTAIRDRSNVPIIMLTARDSDRDIVTGLNAGADDYITKPFSQSQFLARVQAVARRTITAESAVDNNEFANGKLRIVFDRSAVTVNGLDVQLRAEEYSILEMMIRNRDAIVTSREMLERIWGAEYVDASDYLESHVQSLKEKLGDGEGAALSIIVETGIGYRYVTE